MMMMRAGTCYGDDDVDDDDERPGTCYGDDGDERAGAYYSNDDEDDDNDMREPAHVTVMMILRMRMRESWHMSR